MTNLEIIEQIYNPYAVSENATTWDELADSDAITIMKILDAAREDEAVGFAEWKDKSGYILSHSSPKDRLIYIHESDKHKEASRVKYYYTTELYQLYLKHKNEKL